ncbi:hypothetical protein Tco_1111399 [Tanacetum coccineum]|uniref:Uncharacterized protein n=1 Tax=Tanacetum coccineum TaxID=301880 RepID=A0ABQ5ILI8_9ASTR
MEGIFPPNISRPLHGVKLLGGPVSVDVDFGSALVMKRVSSTIGLFVPGRVVIDAAQRKRGKYMTKCADIGYGFLPFSFSSFGELEKDAVTLLKRVRKFSMAQDIGARAAVHIFNRISFSIAKGVGAQIVSRLPFNLLSDLFRNYIVIDGFDQILDRNFRSDGVERLDKKLSIPEAETHIVALYIVNSQCTYQLEIRYCNDMARWPGFGLQEDPSETSPENAMDNLDNPSNGRRQVRVVNGLLDKSSECSREITKIFKERIDDARYTWTKVSQPTSEEDGDK